MKLSIPQTPVPWLLLVASLPLVACSTSPEPIPARSPIADPSSLVAPPEAELRDAEIVTVGWDAVTGAPLVLLRELSTGRVIPIWVGPAEARAIASGLLGSTPPRPMTHDLASDLITRLGGELEAVLVHEIRGNTYRGLLQLRVEGKKEKLFVDTRPSDGLALALRTGAEIRVSLRLLDEAPDYEFLPPEDEQQVVRALGLTLVAASSELREEFGLPDRPGVVVLRVQGGAQRAGLRRGDLILSVHGVEVTDPIQLLDALLQSTGGRVPVRYWRDGREYETEISIHPEPERDRRTLEVA